MIHRRTLCTIILTAAWIVCGTFDFAAAVPNPQAIAWQGPPETVVSSMYRGVLGREPATAEDMNSADLSLPAVLALHQLPGVPGGPLCPGGENLPGVLENAQP
jgi:hypothetical protein